MWYFSRNFPNINIYIRYIYIYLFNICEMRKIIDPDKSHVAMTLAKAWAIGTSLLISGFIFSQVWTKLIMATSNNSEAVVILKEQAIKKEKHDSVMESKLNFVMYRTITIDSTIRINKKLSDLKDARLARAIINKIPIKERSDTIYEQLETIATPGGIIKIVKKNLIR